MPKQWPFLITMKHDHLPDREYMGSDIYVFVNEIGENEIELHAVRIVKGRIESGCGVLPLEPMGASKNAE